MSGLMARHNNASSSSRYNSILRLHMLTELESFTEGIKSSPNALDISRMANQCLTLWQERLQPMQNSFKSREPILCLRRALLDLMDRY